MTDAEQFLLKLIDNPDIHDESEAQKWKRKLLMKKKLHQQSTDLLANKKQYPKLYKFDVTVTQTSQVILFDLPKDEDDLYDMMEAAFFRNYDLFANAECHVTGLSWKTAKVKTT